MNVLLPSSIHALTKAVVESAYKPLKPGDEISEKLPDKALPLLLVIASASPLGNLIRKPFLEAFIETVLFVVRLVHLRVFVCLY